MDSPNDLVPGWYYYLTMGWFVMIVVGCVVAYIVKRRLS